MNFFKKVLGFGGEDLQKLANTTKLQGTLYRVIKDARSIMYIPSQSRFDKCIINFQFSQKQYLISFTNQEQSSNSNSSYAFPIHEHMNLVSFNMNKGDKTYSCFQWCLDDSGDHVGCYMDPKEKEKFKDISCKALKVILNDENIKDHMKLCKQLPGIPVYKSNNDSESVKSLGISSKISSKSESDLEINNVLIKQASKPENRMVHSASYYEIVDKQRKLIKDNIVFVLKEVGKFQFELQLINAAGYTFLRKQLTPSLIYEVNTDLGYIKWIHVKQGYKLVEVNFEGKRDAAMSLKFAITQCFYEFNTKKKLTDAIAEDEIQYLNKITEKNQAPLNPKIVKTYQDAKQQIQMAEPKFFYGNSEAEKGLQKYRTFCQAKINNYDVASLGAMLQTLKISQDNKITRVSKRKVRNQKGQQINVDNIVLHDSDSKAVLNDEDGQLHYYDMEKGSIIQSYVNVFLNQELSHKGIQDIIPEYKLADIKQYKTLKAVSPNTIYQIDPRSKQASVNLKSYQTSPQFNRIAADCKGRFAISSSNGQIRLFDKIGKNANCKYPGFGEPVLHLDTTKDGKWLLATFKSYLLLIPTQTEDEVSLYENKIKINDRPRPIRLKIKLEHLQLCKVEDFSMVPAKFDERKGQKQMFIVSGFGEYVVIWNLAQVIRGDVDNYKFTRIDGELVQTDFMFDNVRKLIMTTSTGIVIKENKVKS